MDFNQQIEKLNNKLFELIELLKENNKDISKYNYNYKIVKRTLYKSFGTKLHKLFVFANKNFNTQYKKELRKIEKVNLFTDYELRLLSLYERIEDISDGLYDYEFDRKIINELKKTWKNLLLEEKNLAKEVKIRLSK